MVVEDTVFDRPRTWLAAKLPVSLVQLVSCHWCVGFWLAGAVVGFARSTTLIGGSLWAFPLEWLAIAAASGLVYRTSIYGPTDAAPQ